MRNLCLALILANLAFAAWQHGRPDAGARGPEREVSGIVLMSEATDGARAAARRPPAGPGAEADPDAGAEPDALDASLPGDAASASADVRADAGQDPAPEPEPLDSDAAASESADALPEPAGASASTEAAPEPADASSSAQADASPELAEASPGPADASVEPELGCRSVGPFEELSRAATAASTLRADGYDPSQRVAEGEIWVGYWVYLDGIASAAEAETILGDLEADGIPEAYVITGTEPGDNTISLGVFSEGARAERLSDQVRELGYEPVITDRTRRGTVYWVDVLVEGAGSVDLERLQPSGRIVRLEQRPCP